MTRTPLAALTLLALAHAAVASDISGASAVSLAARIGERSPDLAAAEKTLIAAYLDGRRDAPFPPGRKLVVKADEATCRISNPDVTGKSCALAFGARRVVFGGREAQALYATLIEAGVPSSGAAGSILESLKALECVIDPAEVRQGSGAGAKCVFAPNP